MGGRPAIGLFDPTRNFIVCGYNGGRILRWSFDDARKVKSTEFMENERRSAFLAFQERFAEPIQDIAISGNGALVASANHGRHRNFCVKVWNVKGGTLRYTLPISRSWVLAVAFSPDSKWLGVGGDNRKVVLYDADSGLESHYPPITFSYSVSALAFSPDGQYLVIGCDGCLIVVWDMKDWRESWRTDEGHVEWTSSLALPAVGPLFVSGGEDGAVKVWNVGSGLVVHDLQWPALNGKADTNERSHVAISADGHYVAGVASAFGRKENLIAIWETDSARLVESVRQPERDPRFGFDSSMRCAAFDKENRYLLTGDGCSNLFFWSLDL